MSERPSFRGRLREVGVYFGLAAESDAPEPPPAPRAHQALFAALCGALAALFTWALGDGTAWSSLVLGVVVGVVIFALGWRRARRATRRP